MADHVQQRATGSAASPFRIFKTGQGIHVRWATAIGAGVLAVSGAGFIWERIEIFDFGEAANFYVRTFVPVIALLAAAYLIFWLVGRRQSSVDFLIATEGEMKKVNWSTWREVWGATRVVIVSVLALSIILFVVDILFMLVFSGIGVLRLDIVSRFFGSSTS
jgi:preprotein translocase SecE subunit